MASSIALAHEGLNEQEKHLSFSGCLKEHDGEVVQLI